MHALLLCFFYLQFVSVSWAMEDQNSKLAISYIINEQNSLIIEQELVKFEQKLPGLRELLATSEKAKKAVIGFGITKKEKQKRKEKKIESLSSESKQIAFCHYGIDQFGKLSQIYTKNKD